MTGLGPLMCPANLGLASHGHDRCDHQTGEGHRRRQLNGHNQTTTRVASEEVSIGAPNFGLMTAWTNQTMATLTEP
jgi:hypothetical protein